MRRRFSALLGSIIAVAGVGCSLILDLEPDCDRVSDCTPYVCNSDNTACLVDCRTDVECAEGYVCDRHGDTCLSQGCVATPYFRTVLTISDADFDYDVARVDANFWLISTSSDGVSLIKLSSDGTVEGGAEGIIQLDDEPDATNPVAVGTHSGVTVFWLTTPEEGTFDIHVFHMDSTDGSNGPNVVYHGGSNGSAAYLDAARLEEELLVTWMVSPSDARPQAQLLSLNLDGTYSDNDLETAPEEAAVTVTDPTTGSTFPAIAATATRAAMARRETTTGVNDVVDSFLDSRYERLNDHVLSDSDGISIRNIDAAGMSNTIAVCWIETVERADAVLRAVDSEGQIILGGTVSQEYTTEPTDLDVAPGSSEFAILWTGRADGRNDVFMRRFDDVGQPLFVAFSASGYSAVDPAMPVAVRTDDGYATFWIEKLDRAGGVDLSAV